jgi:hypothetical protein
MAGLRKPVRRKDTTKPSTALILFLVFFIVLSLGLGVWGYYGYAGQDELKTKTKAAKATADANLVELEFWKFAAQDARLATGDTLDADEQTSWNETRDTYFGKADNKYKVVVPEKSRTAVEKWFKENRAKLGLEENAKAFASNFKTKVEELEKELKTAKAALNTTQNELKAATDKFALLDKNQKANWKKTSDDIKKYNEDILAAARKNSENTEKAFKENLDLLQAKTELETKFTEDMGKKDRQIKKLEDALKAKAQEVAETKAANPAGTSGGLHALLLDVSKGKTLWDTAQGKITSIDLKNGNVYINVGSDSGVKTEASFMVFGANSSGYPEKALKATIEVIRVLGRASSLARITSLYDADGKEIVLSDSAKGRLEREASNPLKEGDLLFNLFFGSRVAIAGVVDLSGSSLTSPAQQTRELENFTYQLNRIGVTVDAYVDLNEGQIKGAIVPRTRYLILGEKLYVTGKGKDKDKDKDGDDKSLDPAQVVNEQIDALTKEAIERGVFIISVRNFLNVTGLRRAASATSDAKSDFRPGLPYAGQGLSSLIGPGAKTGDDKGGDAKEKDKEK